MHFNVDASGTYSDLSDLKVEIMNIICEVDVQQFYVTRTRYFRGSGNVRRTS
jgi:hypothetical protein